MTLNEPLFFYFHHRLERIRLGYWRVRLPTWAVFNYFPVICIHYNLLRFINNDNCDLPADIDISSEVVILVSM